MIDQQASRRAPPRRLVLAAAVVAGLFLAAALEPSSPRTDRSASPAALHAALVAEAHAQPATPQPPAEPAAPTPPANADTGASGKTIDAEVTIDGRGVRVRKGGGDNSGAHVIMGGEDFDSFEQFVEQAPWLAGLVFMVTALVFLVPLAVIVLLIWYKVRRTRMMNETMLKLAERGAVPSVDAMQAIANGKVGPALQSGPATAPLYEQAKALRKREAWSDLRKGVLMSGVGIGLALWGVIDDGSPNGLGLVLLFVGVGYTILWYLEERPASRRNADAPPPGGA